MGFFDKLKENMGSAISAFVGPDMLAEMLPQAKSGIVQVLQTEETEQNAPVIAVLSLSDDKKDILLSCYKMLPSGQLEKYKDIDLTDTNSLLKLITNGSVPAAPEQPAIQHQPTTKQVSPGAGTDSEPAA